MWMERRRSGGEAILHNDKKFREQIISQHNKFFKLFSTFGLSTKMLIMKTLVFYLVFVSVSSATIAQNVLWSENFSTFNGWTTTGVDGAHWYRSVPISSTIVPNGWGQIEGETHYDYSLHPNFTYYPRYYGTINSQARRILSPTVNNGFAMFDLDSWNNTPNGENEFIPDAQLVSPIINLSAYEGQNLTLLFNQSARWWGNTGNNSFWVEVSTDGFSTYTSKNVLENQQIGDIQREKVIEMNLSDVLTAGANWSNVQIRFSLYNSGPSFYFWMIDDLRIITTPDHWLELNAPIHLMGSTGLSYTKIPSSQVSDNLQIQFQGNIKNKGAQAQFNTSLNVSATGYNQSSAVNGVLPNEELQFLIESPNGFPLQNTLGTRNFVYSAQSENPLYAPSQAQGNSSFEVTDFIMATDTYDGTPSSMTGAFYGWSVEAGEEGIGVMYSTFNEGSFQRVHVGIANLSASQQANYIGNTMWVQLWKFAEWGDWELISISEEYDLTSGDFGNIVTFDLEEPILVQPGETYLPIACFYENNPAPVAFAGNSAAYSTVGSYDYNIVYLAPNGPLVRTPVVRLDFRVGPELSANVTQPTCANSCNGIISVTASGDGAYLTPLTYQWFANGQPINGITGSSYNSACPGYYTVEVTNAVGFTSSISINVSSPQALYGYISVYNATCNELSDGQFIGQAWGGTPPYSYAWSTGEELSTLSGLSNGFQAGLVVTDANSCQTDAGVQTMTANSVDFGLAFVANPTAGITPLTVIFDNQTPNLAAYNFHWDFGDGLSENNNASFVTHLYSFDGLWDVTLTATDAWGCVDQLIKPGYVFSTGGVSCTHSATIQQASPLTGCPEDNLLLTCNTSPTFTYQWLRNGSPVAGANQSSFSPTQSGSYTVRITENNCPVVSSAVQVTIHPTPATPQITGSGTIDACTGGTLTLTATAGYASYNWSNGGQSQTTQVSSSGDYTVTVTNAQGCSATSLPYTVNASLMDIPTVCIVGYDDVTNSNRVIWENPVTEGIDSFYVYRETNVANQYAKLGAVAFEDLSVFTDVTANPAVQAYRYKLSVLDTCGTESALSGLHKTIHLTINQGVGQTWNLIWSHYEGIEFGSYNIYRGTNQNDLTLLTTIASNLSSYTDLTPPAGLLYYQIEVVNEDGCDPTRSFNSSKSNIVNNNEPDVSGLEEQSNWSVSLYPNPANDYVTLTLHGQVNANSLEIYDVQGRLLHSDKLTAQSTVLDVQQYQRGMYIIRVSTEKGQHELRFVKQ
jgi:hypothetical protein